MLPPPSASRSGLPSAAGPERLRLENVSVHYGAKQAVKSVSLPIHQGEVLALIGPSGCGKTTLLRTLNRLTELTPSSARGGRVLLDGDDVDDLPDTALRTRVAMVFQQPNPFPMSIFDNVAFALREQSRKRPRRRELEPLVIDALRRAALYDEVHEDLRRPALRLSGGQQQRLCIARAIAQRPEVLLLDEPCSALDPISTGLIEDLIHDLRRDLAIVIVTHNLAQARASPTRSRSCTSATSSSTGPRSRSSRNHARRAPATTCRVRSDERHHAGATSSRHDKRLVPALRRERRRLTSATV